MAHAFGRWLESLLGPRGLIVFDAADPAAKPLVRDIIGREIASDGLTSRLAAQAGAALQARGYHAQATPQQGHLALFLLDELAVGTDPEQGAALAQAVLEELAARGAQALVTTHYERLKALAPRDPRFVNASFGFDLEHIVAIKPALTDAEAVAKWMEAVEVESRKVQAALLRHGIQAYDAVIGSPYNPALHERVGSRRVEGMGALLVAEQRERGLASQQPEFVLRRPKVIVSE